MVRPPTPRRPAGTFIAIVACLLGVIVTSIVQPATRPAGDGVTTGDDSVQQGLTASGDTTGRDGDGPGTTPSGAADTDDTAATQRSATTSDGAQGQQSGAPGPAAPSPELEGASDGRGVTTDTIKIGVAVADAGAIESIAEIGDTRGHVESVVDGWRRDGLVPVHGREVELVVRRFSLLSVEQQRSTCVAFAQDDGVFMVMAPLVFIEGAECLAREFQIPVIASAGVVPGEEWFERTHPWAFYTNMSDTRVGVNWMHWAHDNGLLQGKKIGLNYNDDAATADRVENAIKDTLTSLGYDITLDFPTPDGSTALAVQRFRTAGVDLAIVMGGSAAAPRLTEFTRAAQTQGYKPDYTAAEFLDTSVLAPGFADQFDPDQFDGTLAMTYYRRAEDGKFGNPGIPQPGIECENQYERYSGRQIDRFENSNEWDALQHACDQGRAVIASLQHAGRALAPTTFVEAMETMVKDQKSGELADLSFSPTKHDGANKVKAMRWSRDCTCWLHASEYRTLYVD